MKQLKLILLLIVFCFPISLTSGINALSDEQRDLFDSGIYYYDAKVSSLASCNAGGAIDILNNKDYAGREILSGAQLTAISENQPVYEKAAEEVDIPWQMIAAIHLREYGLKRINPSNGDGLYQFLGAKGGPYPAGPITDAEFLRQTVLAAEFLKNKAKFNLPNNKDLTTESEGDTIKDTFFGFNGRGRSYASQATSLGFDGDTQPFEGSPYVMNKYDAKRDPGVNGDNWGQVKVDYGPIVYPANTDYGAFIVYEAIAGKSGCGSGDLIWPEIGTTYITSCFGPRTRPRVGHHAGIDMAAGEGSPIVAVAAGEVVRAGPASGYGDNFVVIHHNNGFGSSYGHMRSMSVTEGDTVDQGQQIGEEGNEDGGTGISTGSHLHFNYFPGKYSGGSGNNVNPLQSGFKIPDGVANPNGCS
jgi:murein DD-endopeptidase MepM/ murein hydrolase activator NlpD